jgi:hypothetical protein
VRAYKIKTSENILNHQEIMLHRHQLATKCTRWTMNSVVVDENRIAYFNLLPSLIEVNKLHFQLSVVLAREQIAVSYVTMDEVHGLE